MSKRRTRADPPNLDRLDKLDTLVRDSNAAIGHAASILNQIYVQLQHVRLKIDDVRNRAHAPAARPQRPRRRRRRVVR